MEEARGTRGSCSFCRQKKCAIFLGTVEKNESGGKHEGKRAWGRGQQFHLRCSLEINEIVVTHFVKRTDGGPVEEMLKGKGDRGGERGKKKKEVCVKESSKPGVEDKEKRKIRQSNPLVMDLNIGRSKTTRVGQPQTSFKGGGLGEDGGDQMRGPTFLQNLGSSGTKANGEATGEEARKGKIPRKKVWVGVRRSLQNGQRKRQAKTATCLTKSW